MTKLTGGSTNNGGLGGQITPQKQTGVASGTSLGGKSFHDRVKAAQKTAGARLLAFAARSKGSEFQLQA